MTNPTPGVETGSAPAPAGALPPSCTPKIAAHAPGPFLDEQVVTPSTVLWMNARTYIVRDRATRQEYRALRVLDYSGQFYGYWAIEVLPAAFDLGSRFEGDREDSIQDHQKVQAEKARDLYRRQHGRHHD